MITTNQFSSIWLAMQELHYSVFLIFGIACFQVSNYISVQSVGGPVAATIKAMPFIIIGTYLYALYFSIVSRNMSYFILVAIATSGNILASLVVERLALPSGCYGFKEISGLLLMGMGATILMVR